MSDSPLDRVATSVSERYAGDRRLLRFEELLDQFQQDPYLLARNAVQYLRDAIEHLGSREVPGIGGPQTRWSVFDGRPEAGVPALVGQEQAQKDVVEVVSAAAREGRLDRMLVLHGPNGSGKSSLIELLQWGLEEYSHSPQGAVYALRWIFPKSPIEGSSLGFGGSAQQLAEDESYALLEPEDVAARVVCEFRCNPVFVVPDSERPALLGSALANAPHRRAESFRAFLSGNLCPRCKQIYEGLLAAHKGQWRRVVRHVQVERVFVSRRFRVGAVVTQPQGTADAQLRTLAGDAMVAGLPPFLLSQALYEVVGDLPDANRGLLEFSDFLKRNLELSKYLLQTTEKGFVTVGNKLLELDMVFAATVNERHLEAFKQLPEFASFQARMSFVRVPYLREFQKEAEIYRGAVAEMSRTRHVAPHLAEAAALFAVLTRLERPRASHYEGRAAELVAELTPLEKAWLYAEGRTPDRLDPSEAREVLRVVDQIRDEHQREAQFEGRVGASVREVRAALLQAAVREGRPCVTPSALVAEFEEMIADPSLYRFLQVDRQGRYRDAPPLLAAAARQLGLWVLRDVQDAMELVDEKEYERRFQSYFQHIVAATKGTKVRDPVTGERSAPDLRLLESVERLLPINVEIAQYRRDLVTRIGAYAVDHPAEQPIDFGKLFPDLLRALRRSFFEERREQVTRVQRHLLVHGHPEFDDLAAADRELATRTLDNLTTRADYCAECAKDAVSFALEHLREAEAEAEAS